MALPVEINPLMMGGGKYQVSRSLRFRSSASAYLNRTPASAGNRQKWTWSAWVKRGSLGSAQWLFDAFQDANNFTAIFFNSNDTLGIQHNLAASSKVLKYTTQVFRDPSAWYHLVVSVDTTQVSPSINVYVNGSQITSFGTNTNTLSQNENLFINNNIAHNTSRYGGAANYFDGYLSEVNHIDGQALTPSSFGANDNNGVWQPKKYAGTYGTNGFYLPFSNTTSTTTLVQDSSGNGNNWTPNNISLTTGTTYDSMTDSPTTYADGNNGRGNYSVINPVNLLGGGTLSNGNLRWVSPATDNRSCASTFAIDQNSGAKWYWEVTATSKTGTYWQIGVFASTSAPYSNNPSAWYRSDGAIIVNAATVATVASYTTGDVIGMTFDSDAYQMKFYKNNTLVSTQTLTRTSLPLYAGAASDSSGGTTTYDFNFGQQPFIYTPPSGFKAINTYNLPAASISQGNKHFDAIAYSGTGSSQLIQNSGGFQPDFVWIKSRSLIADHALTNSVVGATYGLSSNNNSTEFNQSANFSSFNSNGFTVQGTSSSYNQNSATYIGWQWKGGGTGVSNTNGSITSTVSANVTAGFSVLGYTGTGANATIGHGLGVAPKMIIVKNRTRATQEWKIWHTALAATERLEFTTAAKATGAGEWNSTLPTSTVFSIGSSNGVNGSGDSLIAYCFTDVAGYSKFGSYTGNGSADGPFIYTGFRPRFIMIKNATAVNNWGIIDTSRDTYNGSYQRQHPNLSGADNTGAGVVIDVLSNGFKCRNSDSLENQSGQTMIYVAFAENPFNSSRAR